jgi:hypothetical protein
MHHYAHILVAVLIFAGFIALILKAHNADVKAHEPARAPVCHSSCAFTDLKTGHVRTVEPGFMDFCIEGLVNKLTTDGSPSRIHLKPEPV